MNRSHSYRGMLAICLSILLLPQLLGCEKSNVVNWNTVEMAAADDSTLPLDLKEAYQLDAETLSLRYLHEENNGKYEGIEIPEHTVRIHYFALIYVYNAVDLAARDSVATLYNIHTNRFPDTQGLLISISSSQDWAEAWHNGQQLTGVAVIDSLMEIYDLEMIEITYYPLIQYDIAFLRAGRPLNIDALAKCFEGINGILGASSASISTSLQNNIYAYYLSNCLQLDFKHGWFDNAKKYWTFNVYLDGRVEFVGSRSGPME